MDQRLEELIEQSNKEAFFLITDEDKAKFAGLVAQAVLDQLVASGVLGTDGTAYQAVQARFRTLG